MIGVLQIINLLRVFFFFLFGLVLERITIGEIFFYILNLFFTTDIVNEYEHYVTTVRIIHVNYLKYLYDIIFIFPRKKNHYIFLCW